VLGTTAVWDASALADILQAAGAAAVVAAIDVRNDKATGAGWRDDGRDLIAVVRDLVTAGTVRALVTGIAGDGMMTGPDTELMRQVQQVAPKLALIASGGVGSLDDLIAVADLGVEAAIVGRALYDGRFSFAAARRAAS
jgi:phosphoribosylformimino-5-aminoimidazole carboxamide ribonucleotide (ProFAR) isomerase